MPATNTATTTETKQTAEQIPQPKEPTKGFDLHPRVPEEAHAEEVIYSTTPPGSFCCLAFF